MPYFFGGAVKFQRALHLPDLFNPLLPEILGKKIAPNRRPVLLEALPNRFARYFSE